MTGSIASRAYNGESYTGWIEGAAMSASEWASNATNTTVESLQTAADFGAELLSGPSIFGWLSDHFYAVLIKIGIVVSVILIVALLCSAGLMPSFVYAIWTVIKFVLKFIFYCITLLFTCFGYCCDAMSKPDYAPHFSVNDKK